jgi:copper chaperone CopZ
LCYGFDTGNLKSIAPVEDEMFRRGQISLGGAVLLLITVISASAQVDKVEMHTVGISCGACAAISEVYLRRLDGIAKVSISKSKEQVMVLYKPEARFRPEELREALGKTGVKVAQFRISAHGQVQQEGDKKFFLIGNDRFLLFRSPHLPTGPVALEATLDDEVRPMEVEVISFTALKN